MKGVSFLTTLLKPSAKGSLTMQLYDLASRKQLQSLVKSLPAPSNDLSRPVPPRHNHVAASTAIPQLFEEENLCKRFSADLLVLDPAPLHVTTAAAPRLQQPRYNALLGRPPLPNCTASPSPRNSQSSDDAPKIAPLKLRGQEIHFPCSGKTSFLPAPAAPLAQRVAVS